jgi:uncharacterized protein (TIGR03546 family)
MVFLKVLVHTVAVLGAAATPTRIAAGFVLGMTIGLVPSLPLDIVLALALIAFNVNLAAAFIAMVLFGAAAYVAAPLITALGYFLIADLTFLRGLWTRLYHAPLLPYAGVNDTFVVGSLIAALLALVPSFVLIRHAVVVYRRDLDPKVGTWRAVRFVRTTQLYQRCRRLRRQSEQAL